MNSQIPEKTRPLTDMEFNEMAKPCFTSIFHPLNPAFLAEPFVDRDWQRFLFYSLDWKFVDLTRPILQMLADESGDKGFFLSVLGFEQSNRPSSYNYHWYISIEDVDDYDYLETAAQFKIRYVDFCIYSFQADWGILCGIDEISWFTASDELLPIFIQNLPDLSSQPSFWII